MVTKFKRLSAATRLRAVISTSVLAVAAYGQIAQAQVAAPAPVRNNIDSNGVDLFLGTINYDGPSLSGGDERQGLVWRRLSRGGVGSGNTIDGFITISNNTAYVSFGAVSYRFTQSGTTFTSTEGDGASLVGGSNSYTLTTSDGTVTTFSTQLVNNYPGSTSAFLKGMVTGVIKADGTKFVYNRESVQYCSASKPGGGGDICTQRSVMHRLSSVESSGKYKIQLLYGDWSGLADPDTVPMTADFQAWGKLTAVVLSNAAVAGSSVRSQSFGSSYNNGTSYSTVTDAAGGVTTYRGTSGQFGITFPGSTAENITYTRDSTGRVSSVSNSSGTTSYGYVDNGNERTVTVTDGVGAATVFVFDIAKQRPIRVTNGEGKTTVSEYDASGRLTKVKQPEGNYVAYTYDGRGNVTSTQTVAKPNSGVPTLTTSASFPCTSSATCDKPDTTTDALGNVTNYTYNGTGGVTSVIAPAPTAGAARPTTTYGYITVNGVSVLSSSSTCLTAASCVGTAAEKRTSIAYNANGLPSSVTVSNGLASSDGAYLSATTTLGYDDAGNVTLVDGPRSDADDKTVYVYDVLRRPTGSMGPDPDGSGPRKNAAVRITYDAEGRQVLTEQGYTSGQTAAAWNGFTAASSVATSYDALNRKATETLKSGATTFALTQYGYDAAGHVQCAVQRMTPSNSALPNACSLQSGGQLQDRITRYTYDKADRVKQVQSAYGTVQQATELTGFTDNGQTAYVIDANNNRTEYQYDGLDRLVKTRFPVASKSLNTASDADYEQLTYGDNVHLTQRRLRDGTGIAFSYDKLNRLTGMSGATVPARTFAYNLLGQQTGATLTANNQSVTSAFDALGRVVSQTTPQGSVSYQYDAASNRTRVTWPDGFFVTYAYDAAGNVTGVRESGVTTGIQALATYSYDDLGRRTGVTYGNGTSRTYAYDAISRLTGLGIDATGTANDLVIGRVGTTGSPITYNPASQITSLAKSNNAYAFADRYMGDRAYTANGLNQYTTSGGGGLQYDQRGNLTNSGSTGYSSSGTAPASTSYAYNGLNQLTSLSGGNSATLAYDPADRLYQLVSGGVTTRYLYDGVNMIGEYNGSNALLRRFVPGPGTDEPIVWYEGAGTSDRRWMQADERGSIVTVLDASGNAIGLNRYDEYGIPQKDNTGRFQYTGQVWLKEVGLYYYKARFYSPTLGRFMQTDPIGYGDGLNWYNYVNADPVNNTDPTGLFCADGTSGGSAAACAGHGGHVAGSPFDQPSGPQVEVTADRSSPLNFFDVISISYTGQLTPYNFSGATSKLPEQEKNNCTSQGISDLVRNNKKLRDTVSKIDSLGKKNGKEFGFIARILTRNGGGTDVSVGEISSGARRVWQAPLGFSIANSLRLNGNAIVFHSHWPADSEPNLSDQDRDNADGYGKARAVSIQNGQMYCSSRN